MPSFIDANNLQPFIDADLRVGLKQIDYAEKNGQVNSGYDAFILPLLCRPDNPQPKTEQLSIFNSNLKTDLDFNPKEDK